VIWAVTAATAANTMPVAANDAPRASEPASGWPIASRAPATPRPMTTSTAATSATAAVGGADRPTAAARTSSVRPRSSSVRV